MDPITPTESTTIRRLPARAASDWETIAAVLDEGFVCHVGFVGADGRPYVIPTAYGRVDDMLFLHGSPASRMLRTLAGGIDICVTVTLVDGFVLARSAFHHSLNYRSVVVLGRAVEEKDPRGKAAALEAFVDHIVAGRAADTARRARSRCARRSCCGSRCAKRRRRCAPARRSRSPPTSTSPCGAESFPLWLHAGEPEPDGQGTAVADPAPGVPEGERARREAPDRPNRTGV